MRLANFSRDFASKTQEFFDKTKVAERTRNVNVIVQGFAASVDLF